MDMGTGLLSAKTEGDTLRLRAEGKTNRFFSAFYPVHDVMESVCSASGFLPARLDVDFNEGKKYKRRNTFLFDWTVPEVRGPKKNVALKNPTYEPLSGFWLARTLPMETGTDVVRPVTDGRRTFDLVLRVVGRKTISTLRFGRLRCVIVEPDLRDIQFGGIMQTKGRIFLWLTDDENKIPVRTAGKLFLGKMHAELVDADPRTLAAIEKHKKGKKP